MQTLGPFRVDTANRRLYYGSSETHLTHKAARILEVMMTRPNEVVTHDELLDFAWQGVHVQPEVLKVYIAELRRALRDSAGKPRYIETAHRRGYRLIAPANGSLPPSRWRDKLELFTGRTHEIAHLFTLLRKAVAGQRQMIFITGEAGLGKTTLLKMFLRKLERRVGVCAAMGQVAHAGGETEPFSPVLNALSGLMAGSHAESIVDSFRQVAPGWLLHFPSFVNPEELGRISGQLAGSTSQRMIREFADALDRCCRDSLMIFALDDLHRADPSTLNLLDYVARRETRANLMVIAAADDGEGPHQLQSLKASLQSRQLCDELKVTAFSRNGVRRYLDSRYPESQVGSALTDTLHRLTGGIPLFLCSAMQYMEAQKWILRTEQGWLATTEAVRVEELVPPVLNDLVELELRQLEPQDQQILEAASIVGLEFCSDVVASALDCSITLVEDRCNQLVRKREWLEDAGLGPLIGDSATAKFRFVHILAREVLYCRQSELQRVHRHLRVAEALESALGGGAHSSASELALHFKAGQACSKSIEYLRAAASTALRRYGGAEAAALLTEAKRLASGIRSAAKVGIELEILDELGAAYFACGNFDHCARAWQEAASKAIKTAQMDAAIHALSRLAFPVGWEKPMILRAAASRALTHLPGIRNPVRRSELTIRVLALRDISGGLNPDDYASAAEAIEELSRDGDRVRIASARVQYAWFQLRNSAYESAIADLEESLPVVLQHDCLDVIRAEWALGWALLHDGQWGRMQSVTSAAAAHAEKNGSSRIEALFSMQLAWLHVECGAYERAQTLCRQALDLSANPSKGVGVVMGHVIMAMAAIGLNDADAALVCARRAETANMPTETFLRSIAEICTLKAYLLKHHLPAIQDSCCRLSNLTASLREKTWKALAFASCAEAVAAIGRQQLARQYSDSALQLVRGTRLPLATWRVERVAASVAERWPADREACDDAARLRDASSKSRQKLFDSLDTRDPLKKLA